MKKPIILVVVVLVIILLVVLVSCNMSKNSSQVDGDTSKNNSQVSDNQGNEGERGCSDPYSYAYPKDSAYVPGWHKGYERVGRGPQRQTTYSDLCHGIQ